MDDSDLYWLAGLLEGEGTFVAGPPSAPTVPLIRVVMTDRDVVERAAGLFGRRVQDHPPRETHYRPSMSTTIKGAGAAHFMRLLRPVFGERRQAQVDLALSRPHSERVRWVHAGGTCGVPECVLPARNRGLCKAHYDAWWKARRRGRTSPYIPRGPQLADAQLEAPGPAHPGATPWLAGLLEGEGTFSLNGTYPVISVNMCDRDVVSRAAALIAGDSTRVWERFDAREEARGWSRLYVTAVTGARAAELMRTFRPLMGARRGAAIDRALQVYDPVRLVKPPAQCVVSGCDRPHRSRGLCNTHYMMWSRDRVNGREARIRPLR